MNRSAVMHSSISKDDVINIIALPGSNKEGQRKQIPVEIIPYKRAKVMNFRSNYLIKGQYELPEYNLYDISAAEDGDGIIRQAIKKKAALGTKQGWSLTGLNEETVKYIKERFLQIGLSSNKSMFEIIDELFIDLIRYNNAFWVLVRDERNTSGNKRKVKTRNGNKDLKPIVAVFRMAPETVRIKTDKHGNPLSYMQMMPDGRYETFPAERVIHYYVNRRAGFNIAAPSLLPAIDDVRSLRQLEEYVESLVEQYLFPLFTLTVGTDDLPVVEYPDGTTEVDDWSKKMESLTVTGGLALSHRVKLDVLRVKETLPIEEYLKHFKQRVFTACGVSPIDMGETDTSNRSTADSATKQLIDDVKFYQQAFKHQFEFKFINQLLLERYSPNVLREEHAVSFNFNEIDIEAMIKLQNHYAMMFSMNYMSEDEARTNGKLPVLPESQRSKMFLTIYETPKLEVEAANAAKVKAAGNGATKQAKSRQQPSNQHGTKSGPSKRKSSLRSEDKTKLRFILSDFTKKDPDLTKIQLSSWIFQLDKTIHPIHFCLSIHGILDTLVDSTYQGLEDSFVDEVDLTENLFDQIEELFPIS